MVRRVYVEKRPGLRHEAEALKRELKEFLGLEKLEDVRMINRYDIEGLSEADFDRVTRLVLSEAPLDVYTHELPRYPEHRMFALEYLPGQFDQRADSAAQCAQLLTQGERPLVRTARVYLLFGELTQQDVQTALHHVLNPVESRLADFELPETLALTTVQPPLPPVLEGFRALNSAGLEQLRQQHQLAMDEDDLRFCAAHFESIGRDPTLTEIKVIDTYWSDHCRHTTFFTALEDVHIDHPAAKAAWARYVADHAAHRPDKPHTLMDVATLAAKVLRTQGGLRELVDTEEQNACTIRVKANTQNGPEDWLLLFKNETHNHPTEIEPFGGAATCVGGAIRDPLSARAYVYAGMRVTGAADILQDAKDTLPGKLPQRSITLGAAAGYASYGNQIGVATGYVKEHYHPGYAAKRMEIGAVLGAAKEAHVRRERPTAGDAVILVGGRTGRDGIGGATGSSVAHTQGSVTECAAQVQKGNAPEERKLQRLFLRPDVTGLIKRCNDFGAGGVSVAIGELADGLHIELDKVPLKYQGLGATEIAISESQERMAVVVAEADAAAFIQAALEENLEATHVATVTQEPTMRMTMHGHTVVELSRAFLDTNGAPKHMTVRIQPGHPAPQPSPQGFEEELMRLAGDLNGASGRGLGERFDSTIGAATLLLPYGGKHQVTPPMAMAHLLPVPGGTDTCSVMAAGFDPYRSQADPFAGGYLAVVEALSRLAASGVDTQGAYLTHQEYFPSPGTDPARWGLPLSALLGAYRAQLDLKVGAIGGKDSMSGTFHDLDVPPTLVSFAVAPATAKQLISPELKRTDSHLVWLKPQLGADGLPTGESVLKVFAQARELMRTGRALACAVPAFGGVGHALLQMALGNGIGAEISTDIPLEQLCAPCPGSLILEVTEPVTQGIALGRTTQTPALTYGQHSVPLSQLLKRWEDTLEGVFPTQTALGGPAPAVTHRATPVKGASIARPRVLIPAFPGTNCEIDTARAFERAGAVADILPVRNLTPQLVRQAVEEMARRMRNAQIVFIPGGFSGGDEPDGCAKLVTSFLRAEPVQEALQHLLDARLGLLGGICNGFQALIKLGLIPFGRMLEAEKHSPTLGYNAIGRHQSRLVRVRVASTLSPWYSGNEVGQVRVLPISHGEGRLLMDEALVQKLAASGQIATQYADMAGNPSMDVAHNPNGSLWAVESLTSPDGRVMGRMGHAERTGDLLYRNMPHTGPDPMFHSAVAYYR